jgi:hypothetical protein
MQALSMGRGGVDRRAERGIREIRARIESNRALFGEIEAVDARFLEEIEASILKLAGLDGVIAGVRADSEEMEIVSINALTVALKSGAAGKAFSVITDELKRLSAQTIGLTYDLSRIGKDLLDRFRALRDEIARARAAQSDFFADASERISSGFSFLEGQVRAAAGFFGEQLVRSRDMGESVYDIMQNVQHQDIIRQSLEHVQLVIREAGSDDAEELEMEAFAAKAARLSVMVLEDIGARLGDTARSFRDRVEELEAIARECDSMRSETLARLESRDEGGLAGFGKRSREYVVGKQAFVQSCRLLDARVRELDEGFKSLVKLMSRFKSVVTASRIEIAKNRTLQIVSNTVRGMMSLTERIEEDVSGAIKQTGGFMKLATTAIARYAREYEDRHQALVDALAAAEDDFAALAEVRSGAIEYLREFSIFSGGFLALVDSSAGELSALDRLRERLSAAAVELAEVADSSGGVADSSGGVGDFEDGRIGDERLQRLIERFTIFTHKKAAQSIGEVELDAEAANAGEITLF